MTALPDPGRVRQGDMPTTCELSIGTSIGVTWPCSRRARRTGEAPRRKFFGSTHPERNLRPTCQDAQVKGIASARMRLRSFQDALP
jgi:hypothetical protein